MAIPLKELGDKLSYQEVNEMLKLYPKNTEPSDPFEGQIWLDISAAPYQLKRYNGSGWDVVGEMTAGNILNTLKTVDGSGSGLDADLLDGLEAASFIRNDINSTVSAHTEWQDNYSIRLGNDNDFRALHDGNQTTLYNYTGKLYIANVASGENIHMAAHNESGTWKTLLILNPDAELVESYGSIKAETFYEGSTKLEDKYIMRQDFIRDKYANYDLTDTLTTYLNITGRGSAQLVFSSSTQSQGERIAQVWVKVDGVWTHYLCNIGPSSVLDFHFNNSFEIQAKKFLTNARLSVSYCNN